MPAPRIGAAIAACCLIASIAWGQSPAGPRLALGASVDAAAIPDTLTAKDPAHPIDVRVTADWAEVETQPGTYDWSRISNALSAGTGRGWRVTVCVRGSSPLHPRPEGDRSVPDAAWLDAWTALLRSAVASLGSGVSVIEVGEHPERSFDAAAYAFVLKSSFLAIKAEAKARGVTVRVAQGAVDSGALAWQKELWDNDAAPYADVLPVSLAAEADIAPAVTAFVLAAAEHPPAADLCAEIGASEQDAWRPFRGAVTALASSAQTALLTLPSDPAPAGRQCSAIAELHSRLASEYAPAPAGKLSLRTPEGGAEPEASIAGRFLHAKDFATIVVYHAPPAGDPQAQSRLLLDSPDVKDPAVVDLVSGASYKTGPAEVPGEKARALRLLRADHPMAIVWERAAVNQPGLDVAPEDVNIATTRGLTAEEVIARNRQVEKVQDDHLRNWIAKGRADLHFKIAQGGGSFDVSIESTYFWRRGQKVEWQQTRYYVNGNLVTWKKIPELPLIQPEKVVTLPLDLTFDKTYDYTLAGEDTIDHRPAYVVAFEPSGAVASKSLYRGRVWIDKETFIRLRTSFIQTHLEPPVVQHEETDTYVPIAGPDGTSYILIGRTDGQQLWSGGGRNFVVRREMSFQDFQINTSDESFDAALKEAYASNDQMLRETDKGFRYLEKSPDGGRVVQEKEKTSALFALAGAMKDDSVDNVVPLAGVNWFDYDLFHKKIQVNVFFAGVYAYANFTDPALGGTKVDLGGEASLVGLKLDDKLFVSGVEDVSQRVKRRSQYLTGRFGYPLNPFFKIALIGDLSWNAYDDSQDARDALAARNAADGTSLVFVLPSNHVLSTGTVQLEFNRWGYTLTGNAAYSRRSQWEPWGLFDTTTGTFVDPTFDASQKSFPTWSATAFKEWYLPKFQKIRAELDYVGGSRLDRFSQYRFGRFGDQSLDGFAGTGVRFDTGVLAKTGWSFNVLNAVRFDATLQYGHVRDKLQDDQFRDHVGTGFSFNVVGPWKTIWQASYGRALQSDVPGLAGKQEFLVVVLKLF